MAALLREPTNNFFSDYKIVVAAGTQAGIGIEALPPVLNAIGQGQDTKTITLSCGKLTTGVSIPQWCGMFMLRTILEGTLYPLLTRLKNADLLTYRWVESSGGPPRKYFSLTEKGAAFYQELENTWREMADGVERVINHQGQGTGEAGQENSITENPPPTTDNL